LVVCRHRAGQEALRQIRAVLDHPPETERSMHARAHSRTYNRITSYAGRPGPAIGVALIVLVLMVGCGLGGEAASPTSVPNPTPAPRPTAESPAAVGGWYSAALDEAPVEVRADLTASETDELTKTFTRRFPKLSVHWTRGTDDDLLQRTLREAGSAEPAWDVYIGHSAPTLKAARLVDRWTPPEGRAVPPELVDSEGGWYAVAVTYHVLAYNIEAVAPASRPTTYEALRDPSYFGRLAVLSDDLVWLRGMSETRGADATADLIRSLASQAVVPRGDPSALSAFISSGQQAVAIDGLLHTTERDRRQGGKIGWVAIEPVITQPLGMALAARSTRPNAARLFADFMLSPDAQVVLAAAGRVPSRSDVDPEPQTLVRGLATHVTLPPLGQAETDLRTRWTDLWKRS
jgi:iron(III) transport system substrate-binding protein